MGAGGEEIGVMCYLVNAGKGGEGEDEFGSRYAPFRVGRNATL